MLADVLRRRPLHPGHQLAQVAPLLVEAPHEGREPGEPALEQGDADGGEEVEDALADDAGELRLEDLGHPGVLLEVVGRPAGGEGRVAGRAAEVDAGHQPLPGDRLPHRPEEPAAVGVLRARGQEHLHEAGVVADAVDLPRGQLGELDRHDDRGAQARLGVEPLGHLPVVDRAGEGDRRLRVVQAVDRVEAGEDRQLDPERVEGLLAQQGEARPGRAVGRDAAGPRGHRRVGRVVAGARALEGRLPDVLHPVGRQVGEERLDARDRVVDVAVDQRARTRVPVCSPRRSLHRRRPPPGAARHASGRYCSGRADRRQCAPRRYRPRHVVR